MPGWKIDGNIPLRAAHLVRGNARFAIRANGDYPAIQAGGQKKTYGNDGIGREFYSQKRVIIKDYLCEAINQTCWAGNVSQQQKRGVIFYLLKAQGNQTPEDDRPITLLNSDYTIIARIIPQCLHPVLADHLTDTQLSGVPGNTIIDAGATLRDSIAYAESRRIPLCMLTLDFKNAFDRIAHNHLFQILREYGFGNAFIAGIKRLFEGPTSSVKINGHQYGPITIRCVLQQGCPMSMSLFALSLHPFLRLLDRKLPGIMLGRRTRPHRFWFTPLT